MYNPSNGHLISENDCDSNAVGDGLVKLYNKNGNVAGRGEYKSGKKDGASIIYFPNGNIRLIEHYQNGNKIPPIVEFDSTGKMIKFIPSK